MAWTTLQRRDGFGAIFQNILYDIAYHGVKGNRYVFTPIERFDHNYTNDPEFSKSLNDFMNLKDSFPKSDTNEVLKTFSHPSECYPQVEKDMTLFFSSAAFQKAKQAFFSNKQSPYAQETYNVAIHIRRHNRCDDRIEGTNTPNAVYLSIINKIRTGYTGTKPVQFHIYSQGSEENFADFLFPDVTLHINGDVQPTFLGLVFADELVTSRSSLSYVAGLLTSGHVHYLKFWHPPLPGWDVYTA